MHLETFRTFCVAGGWSPPLAKRHSLRALRQTPTQLTPAA
jgi:hypothetical protein